VVNLHSGIMADETDKKAVAEVPQVCDILPFFDYPELTLKRRKILAVNALPQCVDWSIERRAQLAGVTRQYWSKCMGKPDFQEVCAKAARRFVGAHVFDTTHAFLESAKKGNVVAQMAVLRQLAGRDRDNGNGSGAPVTVNIAIIQQERQERIGESLKRFGYEITSQEKESSE